MKSEAVSAEQRCDKCGGRWHGGSPCTEYTRTSKQILSELRALASGWNSAIQVAYNEYAHGQRAAYEHAAHDLLARLDETADETNILREVSSEWETTKNDNEVTCHSRMIEGVLCRWWGDGPTPKGVAMIDRAAVEPPACSCMSPSYNHDVGCPRYEPPENGTVTP